ALVSDTMWFGFLAAVGATGFAIYFSSRLTGRFSLTSQFLYLMGLFLGGRFLLAVLSPSYPVEECFLFSRTILSDPQLYEMVLTYSVATMGVVMGIALSRPVPQLSTIARPRPLPAVRKVVAFLLIPVTLLMAYNASQFLAAIASGGYLALFANPENYLNTGIAPHIVSRVGLILTSLYFFSAPRKIEIKFLVLIFVFGLLGSATGQRAPLFLAVLLILWAAINYNQANIKMGKLVIVALILVVVGQGMITIRAGYTYSLLEMPREFLHLNGISLCTLGYLVAYPEIAGPGSPNFLFAPVVDYFGRVFGDTRELFYAERSLDLLDASGYLSYHLTYAVSPASYLNGYGTGTSFIAEFYASTGAFFIFFPSLILGAFLVFLDRNVMRSRFLLLMLPMVLYQVVYSPRDAIFKSIDNFVPLFFVYFLTMLLYQIFARRNSVSAAAVAR
ncbi:MAG: O-antigen polysaccharide polymerase Wzy, partial [Hyphomicrobiales bacterium]